MSRYWILDRDDTPQGLPLRLLIARIRELVRDADGKFVIRRAQGYGAEINSWDEELDQADEIAVPADELERLSIGTDEWFYNLDARCAAPGVTIDFGLHDSSALFLDAPQNLAAQITEGFKEVRSESEDDFARRQSRVNAS